MGIQVSGDFMVQGGDLIPGWVPGGGGDLVVVMGGGQLFLSTFSLIVVRQHPTWTNGPHHFDILTLKHVF